MIRKLFMVNDGKRNLELIIDENKKRKKLKTILSVAEELIFDNTDTDTNPIFLLIKELCDIEYGHCIYSTISTRNPNNVMQVSVSNLLPHEEGKYGKYLYHQDYLGMITRSDYIDKSKIVHKEIIKLGYDPLIAWPWNCDRLIKSIGTIKGEWLQDDNHKTSLWLPYGVTFVNGGNHSITTGYLQNKGSIEINDVYHLKEIHHHIYTDGVYYFRKEDDSIYAKVNNFNLATIFAIGDLIQRQKFSRKILFHGKDINLIK